MRLPAHVLRDDRLGFVDLRLRHAQKCVGTPQIHPHSRQIWVHIRIMAEGEPPPSHVASSEPRRLPEADVPRFVRPAEMSGSPDSAASRLGRTIQAMTGRGEPTAHGDQERSR